MDLVMRRWVAATLVALSLAACRNPYTRQPPPLDPEPTPGGSAAPTATPAAPSPQPAAGAAAPAAATLAPGDTAPTAHDLAGEWNWTATIAGRASSGTLTMGHTATGGYTGSLLPEGRYPAAVRSVTLRQDSVTIVVDAPEGRALLAGVLAADARSVAGTLRQGRRTGTWAATRR